MAQQELLTESKYTGTRPKEPKYTETWPDQPKYTGTRAQHMQSMRMSTSTKSAVAIRDYEPNGDWELEMKRNDEINVIKKNESGWWYGEIADYFGRVIRKGWFPSTFVKEEK